MKVDFVKKVLVYGVPVFLIAVLSFVFYRQYREEEPGDTATTHGVLVYSANAAAIMGGPVGIFDPETMKNSILEIPQLGCDGLLYERPENMLRVLCNGAADTNNLWDVDMKNLSVIPSRSVPESLKNLPVSFHARILQDGEGREYYTTGGSNMFGGSDAGVMIVENGAATKVPISVLDKTYFVFQLAEDSELGKLWVMSVGNVGNVLLDRIDKTTKKIDLSVTVPVYSAWDILVHEKYIFVSVFRTASDTTDLLVFNKETGVEVSRRTFTAHQTEGYNTMALLSLGDKIILSTPGGIYVLTGETLENETYIENNPGRKFTKFVKGGSYVYAIDSFEKIIRFPINNFLETETIFTQEGSGLMQLMYTGE